jgi:hypothetical protein
LPRIKVKDKAIFYEMVKTQVQIMDLAEKKNSKNKAPIASPWH